MHAFRLCAATTSQHKLNLRVQPSPIHVQVLIDSMQVPCHATSDSTNHQASSSCRTVLPSIASKERGLASYTEQWPFLGIFVVSVSETTATATNAERRTPNAERRTTNDERRTTNDERRTTNDEQRTTNNERRTSNVERRTSNVERPQQTMTMTHSTFT